MMNCSFRHFCPTTIHLWSIKKFNMNCKEEDCFKFSGTQALTYVTPFPWFSHYICTICDLTCLNFMYVANLSIILSAYYRRWKVVNVVKSTAPPLNGFRTSEVLCIKLPLTIFVCICWLFKMLAYSAFTFVKICLDFEHLNLEMTSI